MKQITFSSWWKGLNSKEKDDVLAQLAELCNSSIATVRAWGLGYRNPKERSRIIIADYMKARGVNSEILF